MAGLDAIAEVADQKQRQEQYRAALHGAVQAGEVQQCEAIIDHVLSDKVPLTMSRALLQHFATDIGSMPADKQKQVASYALKRLQPRVVSFEEQVAGLREALAQLHEREEEWSKAAQCLAGIDLDSGMRQLDTEYRLRCNVRIAMLFLEDDDPVAAEGYIKKASALVAGCKDFELELKYRSCYARVLDAKRRFLEAAGRYYELSQVARREVGGKQVDEEELLHALGAAVTCIILAPPGPQRSRVLAQLYKDERAGGLPTFPFLEKVYMERILRREEVESFARTLREHQLALLPDGSTVLDRAVIEHNLAAAARLYNNIYAPELGALLGVPPDAAERTAARMMAEGRLQGSIDQVSGLISFGDGGVGGALRQWDAQVQSLCGQLNAVIERMEARGLKPTAA